MGQLASTRSAPRATPHAEIVSIASANSIESGPPSPAPPRPKRRRKPSGWRAVVVIVKYAALYILEGRGGGRGGGRVARSNLTRNASFCCRGGPAPVPLVWLAVTRHCTSDIYATTHGGRYPLIVQRYIHRPYLLYTVRTPLRVFVRSSWRFKRQRHRQRTPEIMRSRDIPRRPSRR